MPDTREFDLILQGSTGFTGHLAAEELALRAPEGFRWAVAGRDAVRTAALAQRFGVEAVIADGLDAAANLSLAARTRVVLSCAGPFSRYGHRLVDACVAQGTHYADISGELPWIERLQQEHHDTCLAEGTCLIPAAGFDSVPSDLAVMRMREVVGPEVPLFGFVSMRGGFNGGTLASGIALAENHGSGSLPRGTRACGVFPIPSLKRWAAPFLMAPVNEHTVARSDRWRVEQGQHDAPVTPYREAMALRGRMQAHGVRLMLKMVEGMFGTGFGRSLIRRFGPSPGQGPSEEDIRDGFARITVIAGALDAPEACRTWSWTGDPGNRITVNCLVQTGLALAAGESRTAGVVTPAVAVGPQLLERLEGIGAVRETSAAEG